MKNAHTNLQYQIRRVPVYPTTIVLIVTLLINGCGILYDDHQHKQRNTSLSKAIETGNAGEVLSPEVYTPSTIYSDYEPDGVIDPTADKTNPFEEFYETNSKSNNSDNPLTISFSILNQISGNDYLEDTLIYSLAAEGRGEKLSLALRLSFANMAFANGWAYSTKLKNPMSIDIGIEGKVYFTEKKHFLQPYVGVYLAYGSMSWSYKDSLIDPSTGETINNDHVDYIKLGAIGGVFFRISKAVRISAEIRPDVMFPGTTTNQGFINDIINESNGTYAGINVSIDLN